MMKLHLPVSIFILFYPIFILDTCESVYSFLKQDVTVECKDVWKKGGGESDQGRGRDMSASPGDTTSPQHDFFIRLLDVPNCPVKAEIGREDRGGNIQSCPY